ncbi:MAG: oligopeptide/dipeptide ABC transporter ATP-binding protein [Bacillota bacterium]
MQVPPGCRFHTRCPYRTDTCSIREPESRSIGTQHFVSCHLTAPGP